MKNLAFLMTKPEIFRNRPNTPHLLRLGCVVTILKCATVNCHDTAALVMRENTDFQHAIMTGKKSELPTQPGV